MIINTNCSNDVDDDDDDNDNDNSNNNNDNETHVCGTHRITTASLNGRR